MADGTGAAPAAGADAGGAGAGDGGAAAAASAASSAAAGTGAVVAAPAAAVATDYFAGLDTDTRGWLQNKGYFGPDLAKADLAKGMPEILKAHRSIEQMMGRNRLPAPKDVNDTEAHQALYKALGHPADKAGYDIAAPEGGNKDFLDGMLDTFHAEGISVRQAQAIAKRSNELSAASDARKEAEFSQRTATELADYQKELGPQYDRTMAAAQRFTNAFSIDKPTMEKIERAVGTKTMVGLFSKIGAALTEDRGTGANGGGAQIGSTPESARARLNDLHADKEWTKRYLAGGAAEKLEYDKLMAVLAED